MSKSLLQNNNIHTLETELLAMCHNTKDQEPVKELVYICCYHVLFLDAGDLVVGSAMFLIY